MYLFIQPRIICSFGNVKLTFFTFYSHIFNSHHLNLRLAPLEFASPVCWTSSPPMINSPSVVFSWNGLSLRGEEAVPQAAWPCLSGQTLAMQSTLLSVHEWRGFRDPGVLLQVPHCFLIAALASAPSLQRPTGNGTINYDSFVEIRNSRSRPLSCVKIQSSHSCGGNTVWGLVQEHVFKSVWFPLAKRSFSTDESWETELLFLFLFFLHVLFCHSSFIYCLKMSPSTLGSGSFSVRSGMDEPWGQQRCVQMKAAVSGSDWDQ